MDIKAALSRSYLNPEVGDAAPVGSAGRNSSFNHTWNINQLLNYRKTINKHEVNVLLGHESYSQKAEIFSGSKREQIIPGNNELGNFMKNADWINLLKLRFSIGQNGNDAGLSQYAWHTLYKYNNNGNSTGYIQNTQPGNPLLKWETQTQIDIGADFSFFNNRLRGSIDYFSKDANDLIFSVPLPYSTGYTTQSNNVGRMVNKGVEIDLLGTIIENKDFSWNIGLNASTYKNKITKLPDGQKEIVVGNYKRTEGGGMYDYYLNQWYGVNPENGDGLYYFNDSGEKEDVEKRWATVLSRKYGYELNGEKVVWHSSYAKKDFSNKTALPDLYGSINTSLRYKNFSFSLQVNYQIGGWSIDEAWNMSMSPGKYGFGKSVEILDRWQKPGQITDIPRMDAVRASHFGAKSTRYFTSNSYLFLKNVHIAYSLPEKACQKMQLSNFQIYLSGENLGILSARKGYNPSSSLTGFSQNGYSFGRTITLGIKFLFKN